LILRLIVEEVAVMQAGVGTMRLFLIGAADLQGEERQRVQIPWYQNDSNSEHSVLKLHRHL
jgi:hypothetical protein